jgi:hypothetical protein
MGKVGSRTLLASLRQNKEVASIFSPIHLHSLNTQIMGRLENQYRESWSCLRSTGVARRKTYPMHIWRSQVISRLIERNPDRQWTIVTLVREPIRRNVSAFFQMLDVPLCFNTTRFLTTDPEMVVEELLDLFRRHFVIGNESTRVHDRPLTWFETELQHVFGIDVFQSTFPRDQGFDTYENRKARVLVIRLEDLDRVGPKAITEFLGISGFKLSQANVSADKAYADVYELFRSRLRLGTNYVRRMHDAEYSKHFYSPEELDNAVSQWIER